VASVIDKITGEQAVRKRDPYWHRND